MIQDSDRDAFIRHEDTFDVHGVADTSMLDNSVRHATNYAMFTDDHRRASTLSNAIFSSNGSSTSFNANQEVPPDAPNVVCRPNSTPSGAGGPATLNLEISSRDMSHSRLLSILSMLQDSNTSIPSVERSSHAPRRNLLEQVASTLPESHVAPISTSFSRSIFPRTLQTDQCATILFEPSPVACIDSVCWALLQGRLARHATCDVAPRLAEAAVLLSGEQFHALFLQWDLAQRLFFGGAVTRWTVRHACKLADPLDLDSSLLLEDADPHVRATHLLSAALHFAMMRMAGSCAVHRRTVTSYLPLMPNEQADQNVYFADILSAYVRTGDQGRISELLPLRQWMSRKIRQMFAAANLHVS